MSVRALTWAWSQKTGHQSDKAVLMCLADWASDHGSGQEICWHAQQTIATKSECSLSTVKRALKRLEAKGFITRKSRHDDANGRQLSDLITINVGGGCQIDRGEGVNLTYEPKIGTSNKRKEGVVEGRADAEPKKAVSGVRS